MLQKKLIMMCVGWMGFAGYAVAQQKDTTDLMAQLEKEASLKEETIYTTATFKTTRLIDGHTVENVGKGVMDVKISHRFGTIDNAYDLFGLDNATMRMGLDYGITKNLMVGIGRSTYQKTFDGFFKLKLLRQSTGKRKMPVTVSYVATIAINSLKIPRLRTLHYKIISLPVYLLHTS